MDARLPELPDKEYFSMGEASRIAQVPAHTLRYWEDKVAFLQPSRRSGGHRRYTRADLETIFLLKDMIQRRRMTLAGARRALLEKKRGAGADASAAPAPNGLPANALKLLRELQRELKALVNELK